MVSDASRRLTGAGWIVQALAGLSFLCAAQAWADPGYPNKPVRFMIPFAPGGYTDIHARVLGQKLTEALGQPFIMDNRPGGTGNFATALAARAPADGYTIILVPSSFAINPSLFKDIPYDALKDFAPVCHTASSSYILLVHPSVPVQSVKELIEYARANPGRLNYSSSGSGTAPHVAAELFQSMAGVRMTHVTYKGTGAQVVGMLSGEVQVSFGSIGMLEHVKAGKLRALGASSAKRSAVFPGIPTVSEAGLPGFEVTSWYGVLAPAGTPRSIVTRLNAELVKIIRMPEVVAGMERNGAEPIGSSPEAFAAFIKTELNRWAKVLKATAARVD